eukprot:6206153-Pleurochrysis_carterae.AAC.1
MLILSKDALFIIRWSLEEVPISAYFFGMLSLQIEAPHSDFTLKESSEPSKAPPKSDDDKKPTFVPIWNISHKSNVICSSEMMSDDIVVHRKSSPRLGLCNRITSVELAADP